MSTNAVDDRQSTSRKFTVAELVARERTATMPVRPVYQDEAPRTYVPVTELLRREGIDFAGDNAPTCELPAVQVPALAAPTASVHISELLRREGELPEEKKRRTPGRATTVSSAAVLAGLTIAGLIALKPNVALSPVNDTQDDPNRRFSATPDTRPGSADLKRGGGAAPTTVAGMLRNDTADAASPARSLSGSALAGGGSSDGSGSGSVSEGSPTTQPTPTATPRSGDQGPSDGGPTTTSSPAPPDEDNGGGDEPPEEPPTSPPLLPKLPSTPLDPVIDGLTGSIGGFLPDSSVAVSTSIAGLLAG